MEYTALHFDKALYIASFVHGAQERRDGQAYMTHVLTVTMAQDGTFHQIVGLLHDVLEDCGEDRFKYYFNLIADTLGQKVLEAVVLLTKIQGEDYAEYIHGLSGNEAAVRVKLADLKHNMSDGGSTPPKKYMDAHCFLTNVWLDRYNTMEDQS